MIRNKHIAVVCDYELNPDRIGGMDRFFRAYNERLVREGNKLSWFFSGGEHFDFYEGLNLHIATKVTVEQLFCDHLKQGEKVDVVVTHFIALCTPFFKAVKKFDNPYVLAVDHNPRPHEGFSLKKQLKIRAKGILYARYIDRFIGVSRYTVRCIIGDFGRNAGKKSSVVYNGVDVSIYKKRKKSNWGSFVVVSHLRQSKGVQDLIEAVNGLSESLKKFMIIDIFGEGPLKPTLEEKVRRYGLYEQVFFHGSSSKLPELFQEYSFLIQPTYMECFSLSILESLAANVPVLTTPVGGNPEIIKNGENGFLYEQGNIKELRDLLERVLNKELEIKEDVDRLVREEYNLNEMVENHIKLLPCI